MSANKPLLLHLGAGKRNFPGFTNVDLSDYPHIHYKQSVADLSNFKDNSADYIYSSHVLEYFDREEALKVLKEWRRVLKKFGVIRIAVPDFEQLVKLYLRSNLSSILGPLYGKMISGDKTIYHKTAYDFYSLKEIMEEVGFKDVKRYDWRETSHKDYDDHSQAYWPHMDKQNGTLMSLNIQAIK